MSVRMYAIYTLVLLLGAGVYCQINRIPNTGATEFYLDRSSDCNGPIREVGTSSVSIYGVSSGIQNRRVLSCTLTLSTESVRQPRNFKIQLLGVNIKDAGVHFAVYDGQFNGVILKTFSKDFNKPNNVDFLFTSGQLVTFRLTRGEEDRNYDIRLTVEPVLSDVARCTYKSEYGCNDEYSYNYRILGTKEIIAIIGGGLGLVVIIVIIVVVCCYRHQSGISQRWKQDRLGHVNTAASIHSISGKVINNDTRSSKPWTSESSKNGFASIRRSPNLPRAKISRTKRSEDGESSMYESNASLPSKRPIPPPQLKNYRSERDRRDHRHWERDRDYDRESDGSYSTDRTGKVYKPPTYREAIRNDSDTELGDATEHSFVQADDDHPQKTFVERVIVPRVKPKSRVPQSRAPPPPEDDETYDSIEPKTKASKALMAGSGDESTDESDAENESGESDGELEEDPDEIDDPADQPDKVEYSKPNKRDKLAVGAPQPQQYPAQGFPPAMVAPPQAGAFVTIPHGQPHFPGAMPYPAPTGLPHPQARYAYPAAPLQQPPPQQPGAYQQANFTVPMHPAPIRANTEQYPHQPQVHHPSRRRDKPPAASNPPVYSYLVNRGYQPMDSGRYSPVSVSTAASNLSRDRNIQGDDTDFSANLDSGVELMRRKTDV